METKRLKSVSSRRGKVSDVLAIKHRWSIALCLGLGVSGSSAAFAQQPIRIGATTAITGESSIQGSYSREGYLLCQKHVNETGGVVGRQIEFVIYDDASDERKAAELYEKLIVEDKVDAVLGPYGPHQTRMGCHQADA